MWAISRRRWSRLIVIAGAGIGALTALTPSALAAGPRARVGSTPPLPAHASIRGATPRAQRLRVTVALAPRDPLALKAFATAVSTPGSAQYGRYLTVAQFARRFGATPAHAAAVARSLRADGLRVGALTGNRLQLPVTGTVARLQRAFAVSERQVRVAGGRVAHMNTRAPTLPTTISPWVQGVIGLDDVTLDRPLSLQRGRRTTPAGAATPVLHSQALTAGPQPCSSATAVAGADNNYFGSGSGYTADEISSAYGISSYYPTDEGAGQTVALFEEQPYSPSDIAQYQACYGTAASVAPVDVDGGPGAFSLSDGDGEAALDIEMITGIAPKANVLVYQGPANATSPADILNAIASQDKAKIVSSSWGACEKDTEQSVIAAENTSLQEMAAQGQSFFISSGDSGSTQCYQTSGGQDPSLSVIDPGAQPFATAVGGTTLGNVVSDGQGDEVWQIPNNGSYPTESVWNDGIQDDGSASGTGGGVSDQWAMPGYQSSAAATLGVVQSSSQRACGGQFCREVPDVSADADVNSGYAVLVSPGSGEPAQWTIIGGTSAAAPLWAAFTTLADASPTCRGLTLGFENPSLYALAGSAYLSDFHDISQASPFSSQANNDTFYNAVGGNPDNPSHLYPVQGGYDMATGLGTPIANALGNALCAARAPVYKVAFAGARARTSTVHKRVSLKLHATDSGNVALSFSATGLPAGLRINAKTGAITGVPSRVQKTAVTVTAVDGDANSGSVRFRWTIKPKIGKPTDTKVAVRGLAKRRPRFSFHVAAGRHAPALKAITVALPAGLSIAHKAKTLARGVTVRAPKHKAKVKLSAHKRTLTITLRRTARSLSVVLTRPALTIAKREARKIKRHKVRRLTFRIGERDAKHTRTTRAVTLARIR